jgi:hypothetical protein
VLGGTLDAVLVKEPEPSNCFALTLNDQHWNSKMNHHELHRIRAAVEADVLKATKDKPSLVDELAERHGHHEAGMVEIIKSLKDEKFHGIQLERSRNGRMITWTVRNSIPQPTA